jgi:hypothetical protein
VSCWLPERSGWQTDPSRERLAAMAESGSDGNRQTRRDDDGGGREGGRAAGWPGRAGGFSHRRSQSKGLFYSATVRGSDRRNQSLHRALQKEKSTKQKTRDSLGRYSTILRYTHGIFL